MKLTRQCDLAADLRAPTPSAAAELTVPDGSELTKGLKPTAASQTAMTRELTYLRQRLETQKQPNIPASRTARRTFDFS